MGAANVSITSLVPTDRATPIADELAALHRAVTDISPFDATVAFSFTDRLRLTVDVRTYEELAALENALPGIAGGAFAEITRGSTPHQAFRRRLTAIVAR